MYSQDDMPNTPKETKITVDAGSNDVNGTITVTVDEEPPPVVKHEKKHSQPQQIVSSKSELVISKKGNLEKLLSVPSFRLMAEEPRPTVDGSTQTEQVFFSPDVVERRGKMNKKWTTFPFSFYDGPKTPETMPAIPSESSLSRSSSSSTISDVFLTQNQSSSNFNCSKMFFYSALTRSSTPKSKPSSLSSHAESCDKEMIMPRRKSLDVELRGNVRTLENRKPRPRSWLESSKGLTKVHFKANKFYL
ncbi:hypothetical protein RUM44_012314 [Polyplax serrata]|uniref:Uncharacterized protein n=1 Tax=Polyplax serrata TaxID=468196 RepID=A0ABR1BAY7_POLSC